MRLVQVRAEEGVRAGTSGRQRQVRVKKGGMGEGEAVDMGTRSFPRQRKGVQGQAGVSSRCTHKERVGLRMRLLILRGGGGVCKVECEKTG